MRENIDLTSTQIFSVRNAAWLHIPKLLRRISDMPWSVESEDGVSDIDYRLELPFPTGNRRQRDEITLCDQELSRQYCDCCGYYLISVPWNPKIGLCDRCNNRMRMEYGEHKFPWPEATNMEADRNRIYKRNL